MPGEAMHQKGEDGAQRAKRWLDATTRTRSSWTNAEAVSAGRLTYNWPYAGGEEFSFDVGGILYGEPFDHHNFVAEVKNYTGDALGGHYDKFLAQCYLVFRDHSRWVNQFMFLTWHPFRIKTWTKLCESDSIVAACLENSKRLFDTDDKDEARGKIDETVVSDLKDRLWLVVLSEKQEQLLISDDDRALIVQHRVKKRLA
ncbi:hypothetical protein ACIODS_24400 [Micromonospora chalcea]|uniref:hypothetical protein n=1 Tax=Micromonospora chalcea TaxID=1874 RepID=UPI003816A969